jgi:hypothetical protein
MFTDGRIVVTLCCGTFDLDDLNEGERSVVEMLVQHYRNDASHGAFVALAAMAREDEMWGPVWESPVIRAIHGDIASRISLEEVGAVDLDFIADMLPWRPTVNRRRLLKVGAQVSTH